MANEFTPFIQKYQTILDREASEKTKQWWERYMKGVIRFRGVGIPLNRQLLKAWRKEQTIDQWPLENQLDLALAFIAEPIADDKLAGILFLENFLISQLPWTVLLERFENLYTQQLIFDWNICDWVCVRVLGPMIKSQGESCATAILEGKNADYLWQARSSVVPFVKVATETHYYPAIRDACGVLIQREERFAKTAVGWILRDISKHDPAFVTAFVEDYLASFSLESLRNALKYFEKPQLDAYVRQLKSLKSRILTKLPYFQR